MVLILGFTIILQGCAVYPLMARQYLMTAMVITTTIIVGTGTMAGETITAGASNGAGVETKAIINKTASRISSLVRVHKLA